MDENLVRVVPAGDERGNGSCCGVGDSRFRWPIATRRPPGYMPMREAIRRVLNSEYYEGSRHPNTVKDWVYRLARQEVGGNGVAKRVTSGRPLAKPESVVPNPANQAFPIQAYTKCGAARPESEEQGAVPSVTLDSSKVVMHSGRLFVHPLLHPALCEPAEHRHIARVIKHLPLDRRNRVAAKVQAVRDYRRWCRLPRMRVIGKTRALAEFVKVRGAYYRWSDGCRQHVLSLTQRTLGRWEACYNAGGPDALAADSRGQWRRESPDDRAERLYWALRNDPRRFSIRHCWRVVRFQADQKGWRFFTSYYTCAAWDRRNRCAMSLTLNQGGASAYISKHAAYIEPDPESFEPGEAWEADDHALNLWVKMPSGRVIRPVLSAWIDWRSRTIVGHTLAAEGTQDSVLVAFKGGAKQFGLPSCVFIDNGKNYSSYTWRGDSSKRRRYERNKAFEERAEGIFALLDVEAHWVLPYSPNSKARIERFFGTLDRQFIKAFPSYCGDSPDMRPGPHAKLIEKAVEWEAFAKALRRFIGLYNETPHSGEGMDGRTPLQVMKLASRKRVLPEEYEETLLAIWHRPIKVGRHGVGITFAGKTLRYGAFEPAIIAQQGKQVRIAYDPEDMSEIVVLSMDWRHVCRCGLNQKINKRLPGEQLREQIRQRNRQKRTLRMAAKIGNDFMRDEVEMTYAALVHETANRREERKEGQNTETGEGPTLVPVRTPLERCSIGRSALRRAAGNRDGEEGGVATLNRYGTENGVTTISRHNGTGHNAVAGHTDMEDRLHEFLSDSSNEQDEDEPQDVSVFDALRDWAEAHDGQG